MNFDLFIRFCHFIPFIGLREFRPHMISTTSQLRHCQVIGADPEILTGGWWSGVTPGTETLLVVQGAKQPEIKLNTFAYLTASFACNFADKRSEYAT